MEAKPCFIGHGLMENRCGLIVERFADRPVAVTLAADRGCDAAEFDGPKRMICTNPLLQKPTPCADPTRCR